MIVGNYRHELKYLIFKNQLGFLENDIKSVMKHDIHALNGLYNIRSLYFDTYDNSCFYDNENGVDPREKFRIRIYNNSIDRISLECKRKENGKTLKTSCLLSFKQCTELMNGIIIQGEENEDQLITKFRYLMLTKGLKPVVIVDYDRKPYICDNGNVRVTFDTNIASSNYINMFLEKDLPKRPILPNGMELLEVKYDDFLPDIIYNELEISNLEQTAFSKYYYSRCYELGKNI